jgi:hypothetical protein
MSFLPRKSIYVTFPSLFFLYYFQMIPVPVPDTVIYVCSTVVTVQIWGTRQSSCLTHIGSSFFADHKGIVNVIIYKHRIICTCSCRPCVGGRGWCWPSPTSRWSPRSQPMRRVRRAPGTLGSAPPPPHPSARSGTRLCPKSSIADPDPNPDPPDPHVFGPPGSGSFYHHAKIVRKTLVPTIFWLFFTFYLWKMM